MPKLTAPPRFTDPSSSDLPLTLVSPDTLEAALSGLDAPARTWATAQGFGASAGSLLAFPDPDGNTAGAFMGIGTPTERERVRFAAVSAISQLPEGPWRLEPGDHAELASEVALGWLLESYRFDRYAACAQLKARLARPEGLDATRLETFAAAEFLTRDLINTPAEDMGPDVLEAVARGLAETIGAGITVTSGETLEKGFPLIHTVGRAAAKAPRLIDMTWGDSGPLLTLVGKGVCFDTGGLNLKPGASMGLMKKDMGGAATVLGLAQMIMTSGLPLRLRVLIPAVENNVSGNSFRPGDILHSRKGLTVEINNTDAEGRLVLADALALADEAGPELIVSMATLTGAARVALGPDLAPFYAGSDDDAAALAAAAPKTWDPVWRMPFHAPYEPRIEPGIADLDNAPSGGFAGSITAALFLRRFVTKTPRYMHFDIYGWNPSPAPARPKGGAGQGARALFEALPHMLEL